MRGAGMFMGGDYMRSESEKEEGDDGLVLGWGMGKMGNWGR